ncbi:MAG: DUF4302 domain-containing protein [Pseudarcicella sp.]|nr:DUF4302 domain-containing protein [Pseudarcicella sp.]MBP6409579.1 DUF4302 domain-containing protein [Pseudarcicella sp.]
MKTKFLLYIILGFVFLACSENKVEPLFEQSADQRTQQRLDEYKNILRSAPHGWKATCVTEGGKRAGFSFFMIFDDKNNVTTYADIDDSTASLPSRSTYDVQLKLKPTLVFDTYGYVNYIADPYTVGGNVGEGYLGDQEFRIESANDTKIILIGNRNSTPMEMTAMTAEEKRKVETGVLKEQLDNFSAYFNKNGYDILKVGNKSYDFNFNLITKKVKVLFPEGNQINEVSMPFYFTLNSLKFSETFEVLGYQIDEIFWDSIKKKYYFKSGQNQVYFDKSVRPTIPLVSMIANGFINGFLLNEKLENQTSAFKTLFEKMKSDLKTYRSDANDTERILNEIAVVFRADGDVYIFYVFSQNGARVQNILGYEPTITSPNKFKFKYFGKLMTDDILKIFSPIANIFQNEEFEIDYDPQTAGLVLLKSKSIEMKGETF